MNTQEISIRIGRAVTFFTGLEVQKLTQAALIEHKNSTELSDERILRDIDRVVLNCGLIFYTPYRGDDKGWQRQLFLADMCGSRRWLTYFRKTDSHGNIAHPPRDPMRVLVVAAYIIGYYILEKRARGETAIYLFPTPVLDLMNHIYIQTTGEKQ